MAFARIAFFPDGAQEQYDYLAQLMGEGVVNQPERRLIAAGPSDERWAIIQIWDSRKALEQFLEQYLRPRWRRLAIGAIRGRRGLSTSSWLICTFESGQGPEACRPRVNPRLEYDLNEEVELDHIVRLALTIPKSTALPVSGLARVG